MKRARLLCPILAFLIISAALETHDHAGPVQSEPLQDQTRKIRVKPAEQEPANANQIPNTGLGSQSFALIIGISKYQNLRPEEQLRFADADAQALRDFLVSEKGGFKSENITLLTNNQATQNQIYRELVRLQDRSGPGSLVMIFFAGHGVVSSLGQPYLLAYDSRPNDLFLSAVEMSRFNTIVQNLRARSVIIISDACHSGNIADLMSPQVASRAVTSLGGITVRAFAEPSSRMDQSSFILSAASPSQSSIEIASMNHGLFTFHLLQALEGKADKNADGMVTAKELYDYVAVRVREDAEQRGYAQVPEFNAGYDRSTPLAILNESGLKLYQEWFESDPIVSSLVAAFDDALAENRLTKPELQSAWFYYNALQHSRIPAQMFGLKREELLVKLKADGEAVINVSGSDPAQWDEASDWFGKAFDIARDDRKLRARQFYCAGMARKRSGEMGRAELECENALKVIEENHLDDPLLSLRIAQFYKELGNWEKARRGYKVLVENKPQVKWLSEYAEVLIELDNAAEAETQLRRAQELDANDPQALKLLAEVLLRSTVTEKTQEAVKVARRALEVKPEDIDIEDVYGRALLKTGEPSRAVEPLRKVAHERLSDNKRRDIALLNLAEAYARSGDLDRSISALREAEQRGSKRVDIYDELGQVLYERGDAENAIVAAKNAANLIQDNPQEKAKRLRRVAEYLERTGRLADAAFNYQNAARLTTDARLGTTLDNHARVLFHRAGRPQDAGTIPQRPVSSEKSEKAPLYSPVSIIVPGGRQALEYLTGIDLEAAGWNSALAEVLDACLRDPALHARLVNFYEQYPRFIKQVESKGGISGRLELPSPDQTPGAAARDALKFFGVKDKEGHRVIDNRKEFETKKQMLEALGANPHNLEMGQPTFVHLSNDELPAPFGLDQWQSKIREAKPDEQFLVLLKDTPAMQMYAGLLNLPEDGIRWFIENIVNKENWKDVAAGIYFAAPYLRFTEGRLYIPGQRQGESSWQRVLKFDKPTQTIREIFERKNSAALYLFAALSSAGEAGDLVARSPLFDQFYRLLQKSSMPSTREPFDLIDLFSYLRVEGGQLRLPEAAELWLTSAQGGGDAVFGMMAKMSTVTAGSPIPLAKQIAAITLVERESPDWLSNRDAIEFVVKQVAADREPQLELALDLGMSLAQLQRYFGQVETLDGISAPEARRGAICSFQSTFELLRLIARNGSLNQRRLDEMTTRILEMDPSSEQFPLELMSAIKRNLLGVDDAANGQDIENKLVILLAQSAPLVIQGQNAQAQTGGASNDVARSVDFYQVDNSKAEQDRIASAWQSQKQTRLAAVVDAVAELDALEKSPSDQASLQRLQAAVDKFIEAEQPPPPKKQKSKTPLAKLPSLREIVGQLAAPVDRAALSQLRGLLGPFIGEALLGAVYAGMLNPGESPDAFLSDLVRTHYFGSNPWGPAAFDREAKRVRGSVAQMSWALAQIESLSSGHSGSSAEGRHGSPSSFVAAALSSYQLVDRRSVTARAQEYVARSIDLGEDTLVLSIMGDQMAKTVVDRLPAFLSPDRASSVRSWVGQGEVAKAIHGLAPSELYYIGQRYFRLRLDGAPAAGLANEPGALGALAKIMSTDRSSASEPERGAALRRELRQFGASMRTRAGLLRLELTELESYQQALAFGGTDRLAERIQDLKLAITRTSYRQGSSALVALSLLVARDVIQRSMAERLQSIQGDGLSERDWQGMVSTINRIDEQKLAAFFARLAGSSYARRLPQLNWNDERAQSSQFSKDVK